MGSYAFGPATFFAVYEHITYMNPSIKLDPGFSDIGGYTLAYVNNTAYAKDDKVLQVYWAGVRYNGQRESHRGDCLLWREADMPTRRGRT